MRFIAAFTLLFYPPLFAQRTLSVEEAVSEALARHPLLAESAARVSVSEGQRTQAALRVNPSFTFQAENLRFGGTPPFDYGEQADTFAFLQQRFRTAGKRDKQVAVASAGLIQSQLQRDLLSRRIGFRVKRAYWAAAAAAKQHELLRESAQTFQQIVRFHEDRVREGAMAELDLIRVRLEFQRLEIASNSAHLDAERLRITLFREMGADEFPEIRFADSLEAVDRSMAAPDLAKARAERVEMQIARQTVEQAQAGLVLQRALAKPDVTTVFGYKRTAGLDTLLGGIQLEVPFWNRNQGQIAAGVSEVRAAEAALAATQAVVDAEVLAAHREAQMRLRQLDELMQPLLAEVKEASGIVREAYRTGGFDLLRLLDAERVLIEASQMYFRLLAEYKQSLVSLDEVTGGTP